LFGGLFRHHRGHGCCEQTCGAEPSCGCEPACGCH
jgi:hypothetical protein